MTAEIRDGAVAVGDRIAIDAAMRAGVVGADVARQRRSGSPGGCRSRGHCDRALPDIRQAVGVDAAGLAETWRQQLGLAAQGRRDAVLARDRAETPQQIALLVERRIVPGEPVPRRRPVEIAAGLAVGMHDRQNDLVDRAGKRPRQRREPGKMRRGVELAGEDDRVVAPDRDAGAEPAAQLAQLGDGVIGRDDRGFERARIPGHRELDDKRRDAVGPRRDRGSSGPMLRVQNTKPSTSPGRSETS